MQDQSALYIDGAFCQDDDRGPGDVFNPATGKVIGPRAKFGHLILRRSRAGPVPRSVTYSHRPEQGCGQDGFHVKLGLTGIAEPVPVTRRDENRLAGREDGGFRSDPDLRCPAEDREDFLHGVQVRGSATARLAPLFEDAEVTRACRRRDPHARRHPRTPGFTLLS
jgi:hypothetical protein